MTFSTFDIIKSALEIERLGKLLADAMQKDPDGKITVTNDEANEIGRLIVEISNSLTKSP
jgi:hypothetical protein